MADLFWRSNSQSGGDSVSARFSREGADPPRAELGSILWSCWRSVPWRGLRIV